MIRPNPVRAVVTVAERAVGVAAAIAAVTRTTATAVTPTISAFFISGLLVIECLRTQLRRGVQMRIPPSSLDGAGGIRTLVFPPLVGVLREQLPGTPTGAIAELMLRPRVMETAGFEPAPPRRKRGAPPPELHPQEAAQDRLDADVTRGERRGHAVPAVPDDEADAVGGESHRWSLATVLEPLSVELHLPGAQAPPAALAHPNVGEEDPRRRRVPVLTHGSSFPFVGLLKCGRVESNHHSARQ